VSVNQRTINRLIISRRPPTQMRNSIIIMIIPNLLTMLIGSALTPPGPTVSTGSVCRTGTYRKHKPTTENSNE
jgi:hypothetical protein